MSQFALSPRQKKAAVTHQKSLAASKCGRYLVLLMLFKTDVQKIQALPIPTDFDVRKLPQLWRCGPEFIKNLNNEMLDFILKHLPKHPEFEYLSVDSRTHMLFADVYPNIPGWHCDDFYRTKAYSDQPDLDHLEAEANSVHYMLLIGDASRTEFLREDIELPSAREMLEKHGSTKPIYYHYDEILERLQPPTFHLEDRTLYRFGPHCFHRGQAATKNGWRYFIRMTYSNHYEPQNELRYQTQVYTRERVSW